MNSKYNKPTMTFDEMVIEWAPWHAIVSLAKSMLVKEHVKETFLNYVYSSNSVFVIVLFITSMLFLNKNLK
ncbi:hypothetical protein XELAEV_18021346mg [Xenopus laevis]|uniref:Uncharacterized protein n=1 Tax=Xenopus laevis TaxID=8355 RepID=A0A974HRK5_XENLA|nr:hypothetical protein XELAEV_18021346mg [Xenopus laevis]